MLELKHLVKRLAALPSGLVIALLRLYQYTLSPLLPLISPGCRCRFVPTCSDYAIEAVRRHGVGIGAWLALRRLVKCTPLHPGGFDYVPDSLRARPKPVLHCTRARS